MPAPHTPRDNLERRRLRELAVQRGAKYLDRNRIGQKSEPVLLGTPGVGEASKAREAIAMRRHRSEVVLPVTESPGDQGYPGGGGRMLPLVMHDRGDVLNMVPAYDGLLEPRRKNW